jgi:hypothetical protein
MVIESSIVIFRSMMFSNASFENGVPANQSSRNADHTDVRKWLPHTKPDGNSGESRRQCE